jgi:hypothetical protein
VPDEHVLEAEAVVENRSLADHDGIVEGAAACQSVLPHGRDVLEEAVVRRGPARPLSLTSSETTWHPTTGCGLSSV